MTREPDRSQRLNCAADRVVLVDARLDLRGPIGRGVGREAEGDALAVDAGVHARGDPGDHVRPLPGTIGWIRTNSPPPRRGCA